MEVAAELALSYKSYIINWNNSYVKGIIPKAKFS